MVVEGVSEADLDSLEEGASLLLGQIRDVLQESDIRELTRLELWCVCVCVCVRARVYVCLRVCVWPNCSLPLPFVATARGVPWHAGPRSSAWRSGA